MTGVLVIGEERIDLHNIRIVPRIVRPKPVPVTELCGKVTVPCEVIDFASTNDNPPTRYVPPVSGSCKGRNPFLPFALPPRRRHA